MKTVAVKIVRIYMTEGDELLAAVLEYLHHKLKVRGATVFRGMTGFGHSGVMHESTLLTMSLNLPVVVEFFDTPEKIETALNDLTLMVGEAHCVMWDAMAV